MRRTRAARCGTEFFGGDGLHRHLQRQDVRRAGDGNAMDVPPSADAGLQPGRSALRHAASGAAALELDGSPSRRRGRRRSGWLPPDGRSNAMLCDFRRIGDVSGFEIPARLLPVPAHRRSASARARARTQPPRSGLAGGGTGHALRLARERRRGAAAMPQKRSRWAGSSNARRRFDRARRLLSSRRAVHVRRRCAGEAVYRLGLRDRRDRRFAAAAAQLAPDHRP